MKKLLVVALSAMLVLSMAAVSMAAITTSGEVAVKYDFTTADASLSSAKINFDGKVNDKVTTKLVFKNSADTIKLDEAWFNYAGSAASVKVGWAGLKTKQNVDILDASVDGKCQWNAIVTVPMGDAFKLNLLYNPENGTMNNYILGGTYTSDIWGAEGYLIQANSALDAGYAINVYVMPIDVLKIYAHYNQEQAAGHDKDLILGGTFAFAENAGLFRGEYDMNQVSGENPWGFAVSYTANAITYKFTRAEKPGSTTTQVCDVTATVKF